MPKFDWNGYNDFARWLLEPACSESHSKEILCRNAISRGYYATLHIVREFYKEKRGEYPPKRDGGNSHNQLINDLEDGLVNYYHGSEEIAKRTEGICAKLRTSRRFRNMADYDAVTEEPMDYSTALVIFENFDDVKRQIDEIKDKYKEK